MEYLREEQLRWDQPRKAHKPLPGQLDLFGDEGTCLAPMGDELFETGRDLPGADEREQRIIWDVDA